MRIGYYKGKKYAGKTWNDVKTQIDKDKGNDKDKPLPEPYSGVRLPMQEWLADYQSSDGYKH